MRSIVGIVAGALCALAVACAASHKSGAPPPTSVAPSAEMGRGSAHDEIDQLDRQIGDARKQMGLGPQPIPTPMAPACVGDNCGARQMSTAECPHPQTPTCNDSCTFADSICTNAEKICELAKQLPGDAWATDKCNAGKSSCKESTDRCCGCR